MENQRIITFFKENVPLYSTTGEPFWEDEHISKGMLRAHLDPHTEAASRKPATIDASVQWISRIMRERGFKHLLDLGCGPGLYTLAWAKEGFCVTGIDLSKRSIEYAVEQARRHDLTIDYRCEDYLSLRDEAAYDVVTLLYYDFGVLDPVDRNNLLVRIKRALKPGGLFIVDAYHSPYADEYREGDFIEYREEGFWSSEPHVVLHKRRLFKPSYNALDHYLVITDETTNEYRIWNQIYSVRDIQCELSASGFSLLELYSDATGVPFQTSSDTLCVIARKDEPRANLRNQRA